MPPTRPAPPAVVRWLIHGLLNAYFRRIERFRVERIPDRGPVLLVANHPGSLIDAFLVGTSLGRPVHFVASVVLFRLRPVARLLSRCGVIPVNRKRDDPSKMATVMQTFEACYAVLETGGAVGIFPEGLTYDDDRLKPVKTGAARMALELEHRHGARLGLRIVPIGLTYSAKERYRSDVLVHVGEPLAAAPFLARYDEQPKRCVRELTEEIERRLRALILDLPSLEHERIVRAVKRLYLDRLRAGNLIVTEPLPPEAETLLLLQAIGQALRHFEQTEPERLAVFVAESDHAIADATRRRSWLVRVASAAALIAVAPIALFGWVHHLVPAGLVAWSIRRFTPAELRKSQTPLTVMLSGGIALGLCYSAYLAAVVAVFGGRTAAGYAVALPVSGFVGHHYLRALRQYGGRWRSAGILLQGPIARKTLLAMRARLIAMIEGFRTDYAEVLVPEIREAKAIRRQQAQPL
jgi:1-acyl-sn-glycerol-3-phosphate acyltransferase